MTDDDIPASSQWVAGLSETASPLEALLAGAAGAEPELDPPLFWPGIPAEDAEGEWELLRDWVARLVERFELDFKTLPACWYRHNAQVEALVALRDYERACYAETATLTAGIEWHRALRDVEARLREWTARSGCLARHRESRLVEPNAPDDGWSVFVQDDVAARRSCAAAWTAGEA
ncbi:MAG TPA: hypothetical protein VMD59_07255 [Acidimicrobiales bacterium]|nr:hypothetical protein [Acidimicrobiales bacterium]